MAPADDDMMNAKKKNEYGSRKGHGQLSCTSLRLPFLSRLLGPVTVTGWIISLSATVDECQGQSEWVGELHACVPEDQRSAC